MMIVLQRVDLSSIAQDSQLNYFMKYIVGLPSCSAETLTLIETFNQNHLGFSMFFFSSGSSDN